MAFDEQASRWADRLTTVLTVAGGIAQTLETAGSVPLGRSFMTGFRETAVGDLLDCNRTDAPPLGSDLADLIGPVIEASQAFFEVGDHPQSEEVRVLISRVAQAASVAVLAFETLKQGAASVASETVADPSATSVWYVNPASGYDGGSREAFELVQFTVDGDDRTIKRTSRAGGQTYSVNLRKDVVDAGELVTIAYTYRTVLRQNGHLLHVDVEQPSKGLDVVLEYGRCGIAEMRLIPFIASSKKIRNFEMPVTVPEKSVGIGFDGWVFPQSGVIAVWGLEGELEVPPSPRPETHVEPTRQDVKVSSS